MECRIILSHVGGQVDSHLQRFEWESISVPYAPIVIRSWRLAFACIARCIGIRVPGGLSDSQRRDATESVSHP
jgi:hypothetical protein